MISENLGKLVEIRPGRNLFVRNWILNDRKKTRATKEPSREITLVCVHGTAATQEQYILLWKALDKFLGESSSSLRIHCWAYDAVGCGHSPKISGNAAAYVDEEQVQDLKALLETHVFPKSSSDIHFVGHSYGPNWIYKYLELKDQENPTGSGNNVKGLILISTGLESKELVNGGPGIFKVLPLWLLNCIQPILTNSFMQLGFSPTTHKNQPDLIAQVKQANNKNDMEVCVYYYQAHVWLSRLNKEHLPSRALVLHGTDDQIIPIHCGQQVANQLGSDLVSIPDASHLILLEQPELVAQHVLEFLSAADS